MHQERRTRDATIRALFASGHTLRAIGAQVGLSHERVRTILRQGYPAGATPTARQARHRHRRIVRLYAEGLRLWEISQQVGLSDARISQIVRELGLPRRLQAVTPTEKDHA